MKVYTYSHARQKLSSLLDSALKDGKVLVKRRDGSVFSIQPENLSSSPFDVPGIKADLPTSELVETLRDARSRHDA